MNSSMENRINKTNTVKMAMVMPKNKIVYFVRKTDKANKILFFFFFVDSSYHLVRKIRVTHIMLDRRTTIVTFI